MSDQQITCAECGNVFPFSDAEQQFYTERGLASPPKRCKACRQARRASMGDGGGGGGAGRSRPPRFGGGVGDRSGGGYGGGAPRASRPDDRGRFGGGGARGPGAFGGGNRGAGGAAGGDRGDRGGSYGNGGYAGGPPRGPRDRGATRGGGFGGPPRESQGAAGSAWGTRQGEGGGNARPSRGPRGPERPPQGSSESAAPARTPKARPERPRYDVVCAECGSQAQVPFKPLEGRQVFCQPCYKARKGTPAAAEAPADSDVDAGIVE